MNTENKIILKEINLKSKFLLIVPATAIYFFVLIFSVENVVSSEYRNIRKKVSIFLPQGWNFFTKNPLEKVQRLYKINNGDTLQVVHSNFSSNNFWGFSRRTRRINMEKEHLLYLANKTIKDTSEIMKLNNIKPIVKDSTFIILESGRYLIEERPPISWSWSRHGQDKFIKTKRFYLELLQ